jgi:threonine/homoserine/homoserine lactone efflux protein
MLYFGIQIARTRLDLEHLHAPASVSRRMERVEKKGGFRAGMMLNFLNPSLFIGWLTASFMVISLASSFGFNVGDLNIVLKNNMGTLNQHARYQGADSAMYLHNHSVSVPLSEETDQRQTRPWPQFRWIYSLVYAFFVGLGTIVWFYYFSRFLIRKRHKLNVNILNRIIQLLGMALCFLGVYLIYTASQIILGASRVMHSHLL